jgi:hypothetical protein
MGMRRSWGRWLILLGGCGLLGGCAFSSCLKRSGGCDPAQMAARYALDDDEAVLTPEQVQRAAVVNSGVAKALEDDSEGGDGHPCLACTAGRKRARLSRLLKAYAADEARNQSAGLALEAYYRLAESRLQIRNVARGREVAEGVVAKAEEFLAKGLSAPEEITKLKRQASEGATDQTKLELMRDRLTEQVRQFVGSDLKACRVATIEVFQVLDVHIDEDEAVALGLKYRPDLNLLRAMLDNLDASTLPLVRKLMGATNPLLGDKVRRCVPLMDCLPRAIPCLAQGELEKVRKELISLIAERERQVVSEVRMALRKVEAAVRLAELAQARETLAAKRLTEVEERVSRGLATDGELPLARRDALKTRGDVLREVIEWELARVELRRAQGLLVREVLGECDCNGKPGAK